MSLCEIKEFLDHRSSDKFLKIFHTRERQIDNEIAKLEAMKQWMAQRKRKLLEANNQDFSSVEIRSIGEDYTGQMRSKMIFTILDEI